jgi:hypothetical protein
MCRMAHAAAVGTRKSPPINGLSRVLRNAILDRFDGDSVLLAIDTEP